MPIEQVFITRYLGLTNRADPLRRNQNGEGGFAAGLSVADNVDVDDEGKLRRAPGFQRVRSGTVENLYTTHDEQRAFIVEDGDLKELLPDWSTVPLWNALASPHLRWAEINDGLYATNGTDFLVVGFDAAREWGIPQPPIPDVVPTSGDLPAGRYQVTATYVAPDGRESGAPMGNWIDLDAPSGLRIEVTPPVGYRVRIHIAPTDTATFYAAYDTDEAITTYNGPLDALATPLTSQFLGPPPGGHVVGYRLGRLYLGQYFPELNQSVIWPSEPLAYEWFDPAQAIILPGEIRLIAGHPQGLILGCRDAVYAYDEGQGLQEVADYGVVKGWTEAWDEGAWYFWTQRGLARGLPFENLTEDRVSVPPGRFGGGHIVEQDGFKRYVVVVADGGQPHNAY